MRPIVQELPPSRVQRRWRHTLAAILGAAAGTVLALLIHYT